MSSGDSLRILRVVQSLYPSVVGGVGIHAHEMSRIQAEMGHEVTVITSDNGNRSEPKRETSDGYTIYRHQELMDPIDNSIVPQAIPNIWRKAQEADILHIHSHLYFLSNIAALVTRLTDVPTVLTNHGLTSQTAPYWAQRAYAPIARLTFESADKILCYHEDGRAELRDRFGVDTPVEIISNGIDCDRFSPRTTNDMPSDIEIPEKPYLLFVGRLQPGKGAHWLIEAFDRIKTEYPSLELVLVGDGPQYEELKAMVADRDIEDRVQFRGMVPNDALPKLYREATAFCLPSIAEGMPRTVLEAMASGTPVVTTQLSQLEGIVDGAGRMVPSESPSALAEAILEVLDSDRTTMGQAGRQTVTGQFSWKETVQETTNTYHDLIRA